MHLRRHKARTARHPSVHLVESVREDGAVKQKFIEHIGTAPEGPEYEALWKKGEARLRWHRRKRQGKLPGSLFGGSAIVDRLARVRQRGAAPEAIPVADARALREVERVVLGYREVFGQLFAELGLRGLGSARSGGMVTRLRDTVLLRLAWPGRSKRYQVRRTVGESELGARLQRVYRLMDWLDADRIEGVKRAVGRAVSGLLGSKVEVVFCDVTTLAFCSERSDELRKRGYSKDGKAHQVQVVLALLQTEEGLPVGYQLFPGNTAEVKTLLPMVAELRSRYEVERLVVVGDAGLLSKENLEAMDEAGFEWVVAARLRKLREEDFAALSAEAEGWQVYAGEAEDRAEPGGRGPQIREHRLLEGPHRGRRLVATYSPLRARRQAHQREEAVERARRKVKGDAVGRSRAGRYLKLKRGALSFDEEAEKRDALYDGLHGVLTSLEEPVEWVRAQYSQLWEIEHGFRVLKHTLASRPVFHWTERRVRAHIAICYLAFALLRLLRHRYRLAHPGRPAPSEERLLEELGEVQSSLVRDPGSKRDFALAGPITAEQRRIYAAVGLKPLSRTVPVPRFRRRS